jgi:RNA exonuclease 1
MLADVTTTLTDIQKKLLQILHPRTILIGHSLNSDLTALKLTHPYIIDTAIAYPHPRGPPLKSSLKWLAQRYLNREIQKGHGTTGPGAGHDSIEDARTCLDLIKQKCEKGADWGTSEATGESIFKRVMRSGVRYKNQGGSAIPGPMDVKTTAAIDWGDPKKGAGSAATYIIGCKDDSDVVKGVTRAVNGDTDGKEIPGGGVDFVWGRLRQLEALKGWWNNNKIFAADAAAIIETNVVAKNKIDHKEEVSVPANDAPADILEPVEGAPTKEVVENPEAPLPDITIDTTTTLTEKFAAVGESSRTLDTPFSKSNALPPPPPSTTPISVATATLSAQLSEIYATLPPCTAFIVYSGSGDPREMSRLQNMQATFKREYKIKKWDQLSVKWTDTEEQALRRAVKEAREGVAFITVK